MLGIAYYQSAFENLQGHRRVHITSSVIQLPKD